MLESRLTEAQVADVPDRWALVTGASSGFGIEFARLLAERKLNLVLAARRAEPMRVLAEELRRKYSVEVVVEPIDLSRAGAGAELKSRIDARGIPIDILVNNAGYGLYGPFINQPLEKLTDMLQLNILTVTELTHLFAVDMMKRRHGHILMTASFLGYHAVPGYAAYAASKAYVLLLGGSSASGVERVRCVCDGLVPRPFWYFFRRSRRSEGFALSEVNDDGAEARCRGGCGGDVGSASDSRSRYPEQGRSVFWTVDAALGARHDCREGDFRLRGALLNGDLEQSKMLAGVILITVPSIEYGGVFLLGMLRRAEAGYVDNALRHDLFRAGHAHEA